MMFRELYLVSVSYERPIKSMAKMLVENVQIKSSAAVI